MPSAWRTAFAAIVAALVLSRALPAGAQRGYGPPGGPEPFQGNGRPPKPPGVVHPDNASLDRLEQWLGAVASHEPGAFDEAFDGVQSWSPGELRTLWINVTALLKLTREPAWKKIVYTLSNLRQAPKPLSFVITTGGGPAREIRYTLLQTQRLKVMACAVDGDRVCPEVLATGGFSPVLERVADRARASRKQGDDNFVLKHGAMLHADVAIAAREMVGPRQTGGARSASSTSSPGPEQVVLDVSDGSAIGSREVGIHWTLARLLLDEVVPHGAKKPDPGRDDLVRGWYRATAAWMQHAEDHDTQHLDRARDLFAADPDILFLSGCQREMFAGSRIQGGIQAAVLPPGLKFDIASDQREARRAEEYLRRAVAARPEMAEGHLHLGHVLLVQGHYGDAAGHLRQARAGLTDHALQYYAALMLGAAEAQLAQYDAARTSFESAAALQPTAQAPLVALSELARRRGDRAGALREIQRVFALPADDSQRIDPWWSYDTSQVRDADRLLAELRARLGGIENRMSTRK